MNSVCMALGGVLFALVVIVGVLNHPDSKPLTPQPADIDAIGQLLERLEAKDKL